jgi:hypothetical protein
MDLRWQIIRSLAYSAKTQLSPGSNLPYWDVTFPIVGTM